MNIYCVECWTDDMRIEPWHGDKKHDVDLVHVCMTLEDAKHFCKNNSSFGGLPNEKVSTDYIPWHWVISRRETSDSEVYERVATLNPDGSARDSVLKDEKEWNQEYEHDARYQLDDDEDEEDVERCDDCDNSCCSCEDKQDAKKELPDHSNAFNKWFSYFQTMSDHHVEPEAEEAWNGAIDTIAQYIINELCGEHHYNYEEILHIADKIRSFKCR